MIRHLIPNNIRKSIRGIQYCARVGLFRDWRTALYSRQPSLFIGTEYGGWWVPKGILDKRGKAVCCGCGTDVSFDLILAHLYYFEVYSIDPTPNAVEYVSGLVANGASLRFLPFGVYSRNTVLKFFPPASSLDDSYSISNLQCTIDPIEFQVVDLEHLSSQYNVRPTILKLDIEGAEVPVINAMLRSDLRPKCVLVEFDELAYPSKWRIKKIQAICRKLTRNKYVLNRVYGSNFCFVSEDSNGYQ